MERDVQDSPWSRRTKWVLLGFGLVAAYFLLAEHWAHALPFLPWLFLAACPLMHLFMHHGQGHDEGSKERSGSSKQHEHGGAP